ncbi:hypothetical protein [Methylobacterium brachythecii]|uniref:DUF4347 domain-containing protein n=1 Tax=Methylobacterium brachythecii TaxID=1176177 RepID=A0A7W6AKA5_9HYPH|nr:hypothetical protein [Methylobacterium brachythecii]MBB3902386.1 hypothetical protein [Methylobacterium brachythecii]GLS42234.1 hypothetical protein GCM10007884_02190 [Methylobacterium brachythecii]
MAGNMLIHDNRLSGKMPSGLANNNYQVGATTDTRHIFDWAAYYASTQSGLDNLFIMCHGYTAPAYAEQKSQYVLGNGLQLGKDNLSFNNISVVSALSNQVKTITLFACGPANTTKGLQNTAVDGMRFCGEFALYSGAAVIAATASQSYQYKKCVAKICYHSNTDATGEIDFGQWEGPVYQFSPVDGSPSRIS